MANNSRSSSKPKVDEGSDSKKKLVNGRGSSTSGSGTVDTYGFRRSARETSSCKQRSGSSPSTRKSERLVRQMSASPIIKKKSERINKLMTSSPLRRSKRGKKHASSSSSESKKSGKASGSSDLKSLKVKRDKSLKQLTEEARRGEDLKPASRKSMDARSYRALFKMQRRKKAAADGDGVKASNEGSIIQETIVDAEKLLVDCSTEERLKTTELVGSAFIEISLDDGIDLGCGDNSKPSKRKRDQIIMNFDASATDARKGVNTSSSDDASSSPGCKSRDVIGTCVGCLRKKRRVDHDSQSQQFCSCTKALANDTNEANFSKGLGKLEARSSNEHAEKCDDSTWWKDISENIQTEVTENSCIICKLGGELMFCHGKNCKRSCHPSCLDCPMQDFPPGGWLCFWCRNNKMQAGAHSVSKVVESIWDVREVEVSDAEGVRRHKQYFVKYSGLAHIHNQWILESQLLLEAQELVEEFNDKGQVLKWNEEWVVPQRLLGRRLSSSCSVRKEYPHEDAGDTSGCQYEWLVKWRGLDYENATWELENASFLNSLHGRSLIFDYENRQKLATVNKDMSESLVKLNILPAGSPPGIGTGHLDTLNKLREFWHKGQNAVVFDDQDRMLKIILFIISLSDICRPFLIITTSNSLPLWEAEFSQLAPSIDVVLYSGNSNNRRIIRTMEFNNGRMMLQVLLSSLEVVLEDLHILESLKWKAVIVDECQQSTVFSHFEQIKMLATDVRVLLFSGSIKDSIPDYLHLLSVLDGHDDLVNSNGSKTESNDSICKLKERLLQYIACDIKSDTSKYVEFWVPSEISNVQLEQYCSTLLSNSLCLCSKTDPVGALRNCLFSIRKSCDHPYIVEPSLKGLITKDVPPVNFLDVGIRASGKLQLLDIMLSEMKNRQLRVLILFQSVGGSARDTLGIGDILDDFLRERFGPDTYERVDGGAMSSKQRQTALNNFNKGNGRFVFLLENRACLPSVRLSSVDTIVIFESDWNPANDVKALNKISIDSQFKQIKIFRLYSYCTLEEKVLILAKKGPPLESKLQSISRSTTHMLLTWGASFLLNRLDEFHSKSDADVSSEQSFSEKVVEGILEILSQSAESTYINNSVVIKVQLSGGAYSSSAKLLGEQYVQFSDGEHPHIFWRNLLKGRNPRWKFLTGETHRQRKRVQYFDESPKKPETETVEVEKKRKKLVDNCVNVAIPGPGQEIDVEVVEGGPSKMLGDGGIFNLHISDANATNTLHTPVAPVTVSEEHSLPDAQKSLYLLLKPDTLKLCEVLKLSEEVKLLAIQFLEYVIANHQVNRESASILQAFLISLCWCAASLLKQKIDRKESLSLAKSHMNFGCSEVEADCLYKVMQKMKKTFKENVFESDLSNCGISGSEEITEGQLNQRVSYSNPLNFRNVKVEESRNQISFDEVLLQQAKSLNMLQPEITDKENALKSYKRVQRKCKKRMEKLHRKQQEEIREFDRDWEERKAAIENDYKNELIVRCRVFNHNSMRMDQKRQLDSDLAKKLEDHKHQKEMELQKLRAKHLAASYDERKKVTRWLNSAKSSAIKGRDRGDLPLHGSGSVEQVEYSSYSEHTSHSVSGDNVTVSDHCIDKVGHDEVVDNMQIGGMISDDIHETDPDVIGSKSPNEIEAVIVSPNSENDHAENMASENVAVGCQQSNGVGSSSNVCENVVSTSQHHVDKQIPGKNLLHGRNESTPTVLQQRISEEVMDGEEYFEMVTPAVESNRENNIRGEVCSDTPTVAENQYQNGGNHSSTSGESPSADLSLLKQHYTLPAPSACDHSLSRNLTFCFQVLPHDCSQLLLSKDIQDEDRQIEVPPLQPVDAETFVPTNRDYLLVDPLEHIEQPPLTSSSNSPLGHHLPDTPSASASPHEPHGEPHTSFRSDNTSCHLSEKPTELSDVISPTGPNKELHSATDDTEMPFADIHPHIQSASTLDHQPNDDSSHFSQNAEVPPQLVEHSEALPDQGILQTNSNVEVHPDNDATETSQQIRPDVPSTSRLDNQPHGELNTSSLNQVSQPQVVDTEELPDQVEQSGLPDQVSLHTGSSVELHPVIDATETTSQQSQPDVPSTSILDHQPHSELNTSSLNQVSRPQVVEDTLELPNEAVLHTGVDMSTPIQAFNNLSLHSERHVLSRIPSLPSYGDPLQNELERIRKETEQSIIVHEDLKCRLKSELEQLIAQLRRKYEAKLKDAETAFVLKKNELDKNHNKVLMNKILADAFRSKCLDIGTSRSPAMQQVVLPGFMQHPNQLPLPPAPRSSPITISSFAGGQSAASQQNMSPLLQPALRHSRIAVSSSTSQPGASQQNMPSQTMASPLQHGARSFPITVSSSTGQPQNATLQRQPALDENPASPASAQTSQGSLPPASRLNTIAVSTAAGQPAASQHNTTQFLQPKERPSPLSFSSSAGQTASSQQTTPPPLQIVHKSAALFSSTLTRPPQINPITSGNLRIGSEIRARAPAPHIQPFRAAPAVHSTSLSRTMPSHLNSGSLPTSHALPTSLPRTMPSHLNSSSLATSISLLQAPPISTNYSGGTNNRSPQSNMARGSMPRLPVPSLSPQMELVAGNNKQHSAQRPGNDDPPLPDLGTTLDSIDLSVFENRVSTPLGSSSAAETTNVVCLSDDE